MIKKEIIELRSRVDEISNDKELREETKKKRGRRDAYSNNPPAELSGPYFSEYRKIRKEIQKAL